MKRKQQQQQYHPEQRIKVQLDERTVIFINRMSSFSEWVKKYPKAKVVSTEELV